MSTKTIHASLHEDLHLSKKSARWVPKLLNHEMKNDRVRICEAFLALLHCHSIAMFDQIVTMDESAVSFHMPRTKQQSKQWLEKRTPGPIKGKVQASRTKQMVLAFFDSKGLIYTNYVPTGTMVNAKYIVDALGKFLKVFKQKRPEMVVPLGQSVRSHRRHGDRLDGSQAVSGDRTPALLTRPRPCRLFPLPRGEEGAG
jgi:hypothetical protein